ncbi:hypothetical protein [Halorhabdus rudnickae]|uniref:hypothetical protein n=1 Tax=Halorhabdus rudnickae TaxID=1775544 RepID=UPI0010847855|nr:hypothetical protein [Halorhabdus rudnickae]
MNRKIVAVLAVVALVTVAGCGELTGAGTPSGPTDQSTATGTPTPEPTDSSSSTPTGTSSTTTSPTGPGVSDSGVTNASQLVHSHFSHLNDSSYRTNFEIRSDYTEIVDLTLRSEVAYLELANEPDTDQYLLRLRKDFQNGTRSRMEFFKNGSYVQVYTSPAGDGPPEYLRTQGGLTSQYPQGAGRYVTQTYLNQTHQLFNYSKVGEGTYQDREVIRLRGETNASLDGSQTKLESTLHVTRDGLILTSRITVPGRDAPLAEYNLDEYGSVDVLLPESMDHIPEIVVDTVDTSEEGTVLRIKNRAGGDIPQSTQVEVRRGYSTTYSTRLPRIQAGGQAYLYVQGESPQDATLQASETRPAETNIRRLGDRLTISMSLS